MLVRAVTTIEADEAAASSDFLKKKTKEKERERKKERKKAKDEISISALLKGIFGMGLYMPFRIYFCVRCRMLLQSVGCWYFYY